MRMTLELDGKVVGYLRQLSSIGVFGSSVEEVAAYLVSRGICEELRPNGLIHSPPLEPRSSGFRKEP
jgi:hypothetical protein